MLEKFLINLPKLLLCSFFFIALLRSLTDVMGHQFVFDNIVYPMIVVIIAERTLFRVTVKPK